MVAAGWAALAGLDRQILSEAITLKLMLEDEKEILCEEMKVKYSRQRDQQGQGARGRKVLSVFK